MYQRYAQNKRLEDRDSRQQPERRGGYKEIIFEVKGKNVFGRFEA